MEIDEKKMRERLVRVLGVVKHYERNSASGARLMRGTRYELAVQATDVNGDHCLFPSCNCSGANCARRPTAGPQVIWCGTTIGWRLR